MRKKITVLVLEPGKEPYVKVIDSSLSSLQKEVGGCIQAVYPFDEPIALIIHEEGKLIGLPLNRPLVDDEGHLYDVIVGTCLVVGLTEDNFGSLSPALLQKYAEFFKEGF